jgi:hypothetical protein
MVDECPDELSVSEVERRSRVAKIEDDDALKSVLR